MDETEFILSKSVDYGRTYCPDCLPDLDPLTGVWIVCYCGDHAPSMEGAADFLAPQSHLPLIGHTDIEGRANRIWCDMLHRPKGDPP